MDLPSDEELRKEHPNAPIIYLHDTNGGPVRDYALVDVKWLTTCAEELFGEVAHVIPHSHIEPE